MERKRNKGMIAPRNADQQGGRKFIQHLPAGTTGPAVVSGAAGNGQLDKIIPVAFADSLEQGGAFGADRRTKSRIFYVTAGKYTSICTQ